MKNAIYISLPIIFIIIITTSAWFCTEFREYRYIIFYTVSIPGFIGLFITAMILAFITIGKNE
jgi:hypothetical protein